MVPAKIAALGNVMGGRKLAHYVLEAVAGEVTNVEIEPLEKAHLC